MNRLLIEQIRQSFVRISAAMLAKRDLRPSIEESKALLRRLRDDYPDQGKPARFIVSSVFDSLAYTPPEQLKAMDVDLLDSIMDAFYRGAMDQPALDVALDRIRASDLSIFPSVEE